MDSKKVKTRRLLDRINRDSAGIDCGSEKHLVAVPPDRDDQPVRSFGSFTEEIHRMADWLTTCRIRTVAIESTGVYWIPLFDILEKRGFEVVLVNAHAVRNVPGRKSDVEDCQWLQELHCVGLLRGSFRPPADILALRCYLRQRDTLVRSAATAVQRMQKALIQMNIQLHNVISDVVGVTGLRILRDIVSGKTDAVALAEHRDYRCQGSKEDIIASLTGNFLPEHVFTLRQNLEQYDFNQRQIQALDEQVEAKLADLSNAAPTPERLLPPPRSKRKPNKNEIPFDVRAQLHRLTGADLTQIPGIAPTAAFQIIAEIGTNMSKWPSAKHFTSWLALSPGNKISGGKLLSSKTLPSSNRTASLLRVCAMSVGRTQTYLGAFFRRLSSRISKPKAITATARKLAALVYAVLSNRFSYVEPGPDSYSLQQRSSILRNLRRRASDLGFDLTVKPQNPSPDGAVS